MCGLVPINLRHFFQTTHLGSIHLKGYLNGRPNHSTDIEAVSTTVHKDLPLHRVAAKYQIKELELTDYGSYSFFSKTLT